MEVGYIYRLHCTVSGKDYLGQTTVNIPRRTKQHKNDATVYQEHIDGIRPGPPPAGCHKLYRAINKYGFDAFEIEEVEELRADTKQELLDKLNDAEEFYITAFESVEKGYNIKPGGQNSTHNEATKVVIAQHALEYMKEHYQDYRKHDAVSDLPMYFVFVKVKEYDAIAICHHPLCEWKSFTTRDRTIDQAKKAALDFLADLEKAGVPYVKKKPGALPPGVYVANKAGVPIGYNVCKIIGGVTYTKSFTAKSKTDAEKRQLALQYLNQILTAAGKLDELVEVN